MYCTLDDIKGSMTEDRLIELTDEDDLGVIDQTKIDKAIKSADSLINSYCGTKYSVPFATAPDVVNTWSIDIAIYYLYKNSDCDELPEKIKDAYKDAIKQLDGVSKGTISLGEDPAPSAASEGGASSNKDSSDRVFTRDNMKGF